MMASRLCHKLTLVKRNIIGNSNIKYGAISCGLNYNIKYYCTKKPGDSKVANDESNSLNKKPTGDSGQVQSEKTQKTFIANEPLRKYTKKLDDPYKRIVGIAKDESKFLYDSIAHIGRESYNIITGKPSSSQTKKSATKMDSDKNIDQTSYADSNIKPDHLSNTGESGAPKNSANALSDKSGSEKSGTIRGLIDRLTPKHDIEVFPDQCDILIVGGGAIGSSIAYHLKQKADTGLSVVVLEKDNTYHTSSTVLSVGGIRQQFSLPENILLSLYGMKFMREIPRLLEVEGDPPVCINFQPHGYLTLASEKGIGQLKENLFVQQHFNARVKFLEPSGLRAKFPWLNTDGIAGGVLGTENEGWFDPWSLLMALRRKAVSLGAHYIDGEFTGALLQSQEFGHVSQSGDSIRRVTVRLRDGEEREILCSRVVMAAGHRTGQLCYDILGIGKAADGIMAYPVPIEPRKRYVFAFHAPKGPGLATPLVIDPTGTYFRREGLGNMFLCGLSPPEDEEPPCDNLDVDHEYFDNKIWPLLAERVKGFEELKVQGSWAGYYEYNVFDQNGIVGYHPFITNLLIASGFSGHGIQHSLGVGRAIMEIILLKGYEGIDLSRFQHDRILTDDPIYESEIV